MRESIGRPYQHQSKVVTVAVAANISYLHAFFSIDDVTSLHSRSESFVQSVGPRLVGVEKCFAA